jgi:hypothetical protein
MSRQFESTVRATALLALGAIDLTTAAIAAGMSDAAFAQELEKESVISAAEAEAMRLRASGKVTELRATLALDTLVAQLQRSAQAGEITDGAAVRIGEFLLKVSGAVERRTSELRIAPSGKPLAMLMFGGCLAGKQGPGYMRIETLQPDHPAYELVSRGKNSEEQFAILDQWEAEHERDV